MMITPYMVKGYNTLLFNDRLCLIIVVGILSCFVLAEMAEVLMKEDIYNGFDNTVSRMIIPKCSWESSPYERGQVNWYLVCASYMGLGNARIIPSMISFGMIPMTYFMVRKMSNNVVALLSTAALAFTPTFFIFDTSAAFAQTWSILFMASLYFARKKPYVVVPLFTASVFAKAIPIVWLPIIIYLVMTSGFPKREKRITVLMLCGIVSAIAAYMLGVAIVIPMSVSSASIHNGLDITWESFRWSEPILLLLPFVVSFHVVFQKRFNLRREPLMLAIYSIISIFVISSFTTAGYFPYRIIPNLILMTYCYSSLFHELAYPGLLKSMRVKQ